MSFLLRSFVDKLVEKIREEETYANGYNENDIIRLIWGLYDDYTMEDKK